MTNYRILEKPSEQPIPDVRQYVAKYEKISLKESKNIKEFSQNKEYMPVIK